MKSLKTLLALSLLALAACADLPSATRVVPDAKIKPHDIELIKKSPDAGKNDNFPKLDVPYKTAEKPGTIVVDTTEKYLYHVKPEGRAIRYAITVGAEGFEWSGTSYVARKAEWPSWTAPAEMLKRWPHLPPYFAGGSKNPLGARALYLYIDKKDTLYRIHGTNEPESIGQATSSGCIRLTNMDIIHLFEQVPVGTKVIVQ